MGKRSVVCYLINLETLCTEQVHGNPREVEGHACNQWEANGRKEEEEKEKN